MPLRRPATASTIGRPNFRRFEARASSYRRQAGHLWDLRGPHRRFVVVMLPSLVFRHVDFGPSICGAVGSLASPTWADAPAAIGQARFCKTARESELLSEHGWRLLRTLQPDRIFSVVALRPLRSQIIDGESAAGILPILRAEWAKLPRECVSGSSWLAWQRWSLVGQSAMRMQLRVVLAWRRRSLVAFKFEFALL